MDDLGVFLFYETSIYKHIYIYVDLSEKWVVIFKTIYGVFRAIETTAP